MASSRSRSRKAPGLAHTIHHNPRHTIHYQGITPPLPPHQAVEAVFFASLGLNPEVQTWCLAVLLLVWMVYALLGLPYLLIGMNVKEVVFSIIRVVAMFVVAWPSMEWMDMSTCSFYVACLNFLSMCVYLAATMAPAAAFVAQLAGYLLEGCAGCAGYSLLSPAALVANLLSGSMTDAMVQGLFDQENESVQVSNPRGKKSPSLPPLPVLSSTPLPIQSTPPLGCRPTRDPTPPNRTLRTAWQPSSPPTPPTPPTPPSQELRPAHF